MAYLALTFDMSAAEGDAFADALLAAGALSVDVADPTAGTADECPAYAEPSEPSAEAWPRYLLTALFPENADSAAAVARAAATAGVPAPEPLAERRVPEEDWVRVTRAQFGPIRVAEGLWIVPSWCQPPEPGATHLVLDPGLAFGTGSHPTTRLCLRWLTARIRGGESVLDYGCGSGILAIAAKKRGAGDVAGVDLDPDAIEASRENAQRNQVEVTFYLPAADPGGTYDLVAANILANPLRMLAPVLATRVREGGRLILAGILEPQVDEMIEAYSRWFNIDAWAREEGWVALEAVRTKAP